MDGVGSLLDTGKLSEMLEALQACVGLPVQRIGQDGAVLEAYGQATPFCRLLKQRVLSPLDCRKAHLDGGRFAQSLGESYIFACHAGLYHIAFPLARGQVLLGAVIVGPFLMDTPDSTLVSDLSDRYGLPSATLLELYDELSTVRVIPPDQAGQISKLLYFLLAPLIPDQGRALHENQEKLYQQARISETIQMYKAQGTQAGDSYPYEKEKELLTKVRTGNIQEAKGVLNDLLGYVFFCEGGRMDTMKNRSLELCALLSRIAIEGGAVTDSVFKLNNQYLSRLQSVDTMEAFCYQMQEIVEAFMDAMFAPADVPGQETVRRAVRYIAQHYAEPITLDDVADHVSLSPAYFSGVFKRGTGAGFRAYLNQVRVEESKRLLTTTDYPLVDIAIAMGFADQSYYSKVFKKYTGLSPKQYR